LSMGCWGLRARSTPPKSSKHTRFCWNRALLCCRCSLRRFRSRLGERPIVIFRADRRSGAHARLPSARAFRVVKLRERSLLDDSVMLRRAQGRSQRSKSSCFCKGHDRLEAVIWHERRDEVWTVAPVSWCARGEATYAHAWDSFKTRIEDGCCGVYRFLLVVCSCRLGIEVVCEFLPCLENCVDDFSRLDNRVNTWIGRVLGS